MNHLRIKTANRTNVRLSQADARAVLAARGEYVSLVDEIEAAERALSELQNRRAELYNRVTGQHSTSQDYHVFCAKASLLYNGDAAGATQGDRIAIRSLQNAIDHEQTRAR